MLFDEVVELVGMDTLLIAIDAELEALRQALRRRQRVLALELEHAHQQARPRVARGALGQHGEEVFLRQPRTSWASMNRRVGSAASNREPSYTSDVLAPRVSPSYELIDQLTGRVVTAMANDAAPIEHSFG